MLALFVINICMYISSIRRKIGVIVLFVFYCLSLSLTVALARKRTIPTEQPPLVGEVSANFCR
jgi:hypothetical protein